MVNKIDLLLSEYEQLTGRSPTWREDLSISDYLQLRDYAKKTSLGSSVCRNDFVDTKPTLAPNPLKENVNRDIAPTGAAKEESNNTVQFKEAVKRQETHKESKQSAVDILKAIKD